VRFIVAALWAAALLSGQGTPDPLLSAMKDEVERSKTLEITGLAKPYFIEYTVEDVRSYSISATLGAVLATNTSRNRVPRIRVRVGDYSFDNSNYVLSDAGSTGGELPIDDDYSVLRRTFWLLTDRAFKSAVEVITRKQAAMKNTTQQEALADFWKAPPVQKIEPIRPPSVSVADWSKRLRSISTVFSSYPEVLSSGVTFQATDATFYLANSEGSTLRLPDTISIFEVRATGQAPDGMNVRDSATLPVLDEKALPPEAELRKRAEQVAQNVKALIAAPVAESYSGPVLFEGVAGAQIFAEVLGPQLTLPRRPIGEPGRSTPFIPSEFETRVDYRVLPEFMDVVDDPTQKAWNGVPLIGFYQLDYEAVAPTAVPVIEKGRIKRFLLTRQPVRGQQGTNGHARMPGSYGANAAAITNLFVKSSETVKKDELKARLIKLVQDRQRPYGIIVRKMDFPTTAPQDELRRSFMAASQSGGGARPVSAPLQVFRVYPNGKEELVRGLRFRGLGVRSLRDILAVSDESFVFHYMNTLAPMSLPGGGHVAPTSVIAPSILLEDVELERPQEDLPRLPIAPPPPLTVSAAPAAR
jgi:predicted Zn-dependent protease